MCSCLFCPGRLHRAACLHRANPPPPPPPPSSSLPGRLPAGRLEHSGRTAPQLSACGERREAAVASGAARGGCSKRRAGSRAAGRNGASREDWEFEFGKYPLGPVALLGLNSFTSIVLFLGSSCCALVSLPDASAAGRTPPLLCSTGREEERGVCINHCETGVATQSKPPQDI